MDFEYYSIFKPTFNLQTFAIQLLIANQRNEVFLVLNSSFQMMLFVIVILIIVFFSFGTFFFFSNK